MPDFDKLIKIRRNRLIILTIISFVLAVVSVVFLIIGESKVVRAFTILGSAGFSYLFIGFLCKLFTFLGDNHLVETEIEGYKILIYKRPFFVIDLYINGIYKRDFVFDRTDGVKYVRLDNGKLLQLAPANHGFLITICDENSTKIC